MRISVTIYICVIFTSVFGDNNILNNASNSGNISFNVGAANYASQSQYSALENQTAGQNARDGTSISGKGHFINIGGKIVGNISNNYYFQGKLKNKNDHSSSSSEDSSLTATESKYESPPAQETSTKTSLYNY